MKSTKDNLTNEKLKARFPSQFDLVNYAIKHAEGMVESGKASRVIVAGQNQDNVALQTLYEIVSGRDKFPLRQENDFNEDADEKNTR